MRDLLVVTFLCLIESRGIVEGVMGDLSEKIERDLRREEFEKDDSSQGLTGGRRTSDKGKEGAPLRGGKKSSVKK